MIKTESRVLSFSMSVYKLLPDSDMLKEATYTYDGLSSFVKPATNSYGWSSFGFAVFCKDQSGVGSARQDISQTDVEAAAGSVKSLIAYRVIQFGVFYDPHIGAERPCDVLISSKGQVRFMLEA